MFFVERNISSIYNIIKIVDEVGSPFSLKGVKPMSAYEIIMIILGILTVVISFGALIVLICRNNDK